MKVGGGGGGYTERRADRVTSVSPSVRIGGVGVWRGTGAIGDAYKSRGKRNSGLSTNIATVTRATMSRLALSRAQIFCENSAAISPIGSSPWRTKYTPPSMMSGSSTWLRVHRAIHRGTSGFVIRSGWSLLWDASMNLISGPPRPQGVETLNTRSFPTKRTVSWYDIRMIKRLDLSFNLPLCFFKGTKDLRFPRVRKITLACCVESIKLVLCEILLLFNFFFHKPRSAGLKEFSNGRYLFCEKN